jgi:hypothetical protein
VFGNPPFSGAKTQDDKQRAQVRAIANLGGSGGTLDYVAAWFLKAGAYVNGQALSNEVGRSVGRCKTRANPALRLSRSLRQIPLRKASKSRSYGHFCFRVTDWRSASRTAPSHGDRTRKAKRMFMSSSSA